MRTLKFVAALAVLALTGCPNPPQPTQQPTILPQQGTGTDRALIVGINAYPGCPLSGCVNDAKNMRAYLLALGIKSKNIVMLLDGQATTAAILNQLNWLVGVSAGSRCYFHYSGHGAQVQNANDADGLSEVICPVDFDWTPEHMIIDKDFVTIFKKIVPGVKFNWCSDSCHSGDLDRMIPKPGVKIVARQMIPPPKIAAAIAKIKAAPHKKTTIRELIGGVLNVGYVSACRSDQTAADTVVDGQACGAFTAYFLKALNDLPTDYTLSAVVEKTKASLLNNGYDQVPQADGPRASLPLLQ